MPIELGTKNTLLDGALTLNGDVFFYNYTGYQISRIVDRTAINDNFNATVKGAELETTWEPVPGLKFNFAGGYEDTRIDNGQSSIDLMDRTAGNPNWMVVKPFVTQASNCILPVYVVAAALEESTALEEGSSPAMAASAVIVKQPITATSIRVTELTYAENPTMVAGPIRRPPSIRLSGFRSTSVDPNAPADVNDDLGRRPTMARALPRMSVAMNLPNAPHFTTSLSAEYTMPVSEDWAATLHGDFYWQSQSWARVFNDRPYDKIRGYSTRNLALILTSASGWQVMGYVKNVFNVDRHHRRLPEQRRQRPDNQRVPDRSAPLSACASRRTGERHGNEKRKRKSLPPPLWGGRSDERSETDRVGGRRLWWAPPPTRLAPLADLPTGGR